MYVYVFRARAERSALFVGSRSIHFENDIMGDARDTDMAFRGAAKLAAPVLRRDLHFDQPKQTPLVICQQFPSPI